MGQVSRNIRDVRIKDLKTYESGIFYILIENESGDWEKLEYTNPPTLELAKTTKPSKKNATLRTN